MPWLIDVLGLQLLSWALGMLITVVLLDTATGFVRDHPPLAWRIAGGMTGPVALISLACLLLFGIPLWLSLAVVLPFVLMALAWSCSWLRSPADRRRQRGREATILGVITVLVVSLEHSVALGQSVLVLAACAGSAALLGGLGTILLTTLLGGRCGEVEAPATPYGVPARVVATGLGITLMAILDTGLVHGTGSPVALLLLWVICSLMLPLGLVAAGHRLFPRWQPPIWATAFSSVVVGQVALSAAIFLA